MKQKIPKNIRRKLAKIPLVQKYLSKRRLAQYVNELHKTKPIFVYQMGKVASSSVYSSIKKQYSGHVIHGHNLRKLKKNAEVVQFYALFQKYNFNIKIISLVREPIGRNISAFFENFERDVGIKYNESKYSTLELRDIFLEKFGHDIPLSWYDDCFKEPFGIDVYNYEFPANNYLIVAKGPVSLLLMKHDLSDPIKEKLIREFIGVEDFKLINANISKDKEYARQYREMKKLKLPKEYVEEMLSSKYAIHFYKEDIPELKVKYS